MVGFVYVGVGVVEVVLCFVGDDGGYVVFVVDGYVVLVVGLGVGGWCVCEC